VCGYEEAPPAAVQVHLSDGSTANAACVFPKHALPW